MEVHWPPEAEPDWALAQKAVLSDYQLEVALWLSLNFKKTHTQSENWVGCAMGTRAAPEGRLGRGEAGSGARLWKRGPAGPEQ